MGRERVVLDTNVLVSGLLSVSSPPAQVIEHATTHGQVLGSAATLRELIETLDSPEFDRYVSRERRQDLLIRLVPLVEMIEIVQHVHASRDGDDDKFLDLAVNGRASVLVSGDKDLLELHPYRGILILTPRQYLARLPATAG